MFPTQEACESERAIVIHDLAETGRTDWGFSQDPYGSVSKCVKVTLDKVERRT